VAVASDQSHKHVAVTAVPEGAGSGLRFKKLDLCLTNASHIVGDTFEIEIGYNSGEHQFMERTASFKTNGLWRAQLHGVVNQGVVVGCLVHAETVTRGALRMACGFWQRGVHLPTGCILG